MYKVKKSSNPFYIENNQTFRQIFLTNLNKLGDAATKKTGLDEIRDLLINQVQDADRINLVLTLLSENSDHQKATGKKESMKVIGLMAEIYEDKLANFLPRINQIMSKKLKENDPQIHDSLSASMGNLVSYTLRNLELEPAYKNLTAIFNMLYQLCNKGSRYTQIGGALCMAKVIQCSPFEFLYIMANDIILKIVDLLRIHICKAHFQLFECLISLILAFEGNGEKLEPSAKNMLPTAIDNLTNGDWNIRKIAVEVIYTLSVVVPEAIVPYKHELLEVLGQCRFDKIKNVRDVSLTTIASIKELRDPEKPDKLSYLQNDALPEKDTATFHSKHSSLENKHYHTLDPRKSDEERNWVRNSPRENKRNSPGGRHNLKVNPDFFSNAPKHNGDIEIYTKSPPRAFVMETEASGKKGSATLKQDNQVMEVQESPNRTFKYIITDQKLSQFEESANDPDSGQHLKNREEEEEAVIAAYRNFRNQPESAKQSQSLTVNKDVEMGPTPPRREERERQVEIEEKRPLDEEKRPLEEEDLRASNVGSNVSSRNQGSQDNYKRGREDEIPSATQTHSRLPDDNFAEVFKQLTNITNQQSTMMESINSFQSTTHNELGFLKSRVKELEEFIQKSYNSQRGAPPAYTYPPPPHYSYMPPYQPMAQPPMHPQYPTQYTNYTPPYYHPSGVGMGPNPPRYQDNHYARRSMGDYPPSQNYASTQGPISYQKQFNEGDRSERQASSTYNPRSGDNNGRMQYESQRVPASARVEKVEEETRREVREEPEQRKSSSKKRLGESAGKHALWERIQDLLNRSQVSAAYELCLNEGDEETLLNLMVDTGNIVEYLDTVIVENLLSGLKSRLFDESHRDLVLNWIEKALNSNVGVSRGTFIALHDILVQMIEEGTKVSGLESEKVKRVINEIKKMLDSTIEKSEPPAAEEQLSENGADTEEKEVNESEVNETK